MEEWEEQLMGGEEEVEVEEVGMEKGEDSRSSKEGERRGRGDDGAGEDRDRGEEDDS
jgi:hypothetical protein